MTRIIFIILFNIALIVAQVFITLKNRGKIGLIIPIFNVVGAIAFALFISPYSSTLERYVNGVKVVSESVNIGAFLGDFIPLLLLFLIPAIINFILYFNSKKKTETKVVNDLDKMKINDM